MLKLILGWLTSGPLDRVLDTIDKRVDAETDKERLRSEIIREHYRTRADWMRSGGQALMLAFALPLAFWFTAVVIYSVFWCAGCVYPQEWTIAALPPPLDQWAGLIIISIFGVIGVSRFK